MRIITRDEWGARAGDGRYWTELPATEVWLHHSVTIAPDLVPPFDDDDDAIRTIERIGRERFGDVYGFPYSFAVTPVGRIYEGHRINKTGAHTAGHNTVGRAICLVGNYEDDEPTEAMLGAVGWLLRLGKDRGWWRHAALTGGHRDVKATACPGARAYRLIDDINRSAAAPSEEDDMLTDDDIRRIWEHPVHYWPQRAGHDDPPTMPAWRQLHQARGIAHQTNTVAVGLRAAVNTLADALAAQQGADAEAIKTAVREAIEASVVDVDVDVTDKTGGTADEEN